MKLKEFGPRGRRCVPRAPLDPPLLNVFKVNMVNLTTADSGFPRGAPIPRGPKMYENLADGAGVQNVTM